MARTFNSVLPQAALLNLHALAPISELVMFLGWPWSLLGAVGVKEELATEASLQFHYPVAAAVSLGWALLETPIKLTVFPGIVGQVWAVV